MRRVFSTAAATASSTRKRWIEKILARVFCPEDKAVEGGNPVTIFATLDDDEHTQHKSRPLSRKTQSNLAQSCDWESVMVHPSSSIDSQRKQLSFYVPNGTEVSFCAHAAMAGAIRVANEIEESIDLHCPMLLSQDKDNKTGNSNPSVTVHDDDIVSLHIRNAPYEKHVIDQAPSLYRLLREQMKLRLEHLPVSTETNFPTFCTVSVARPKTLVYVKDAETLLRVCQAPESAEFFARACKNLNTTGLYLYTQHPDLDVTYLCRQFPANSGYPEDAATGIAAAALAASLPNEVPFLKFHQGASMKRPSLLLVEHMRLTVHEEEEEEEEEEEKTGESERNEKQEEPQHEPNPIFPEKPKPVFGNVSYKLMGKIEIDKTEEIEVEDEEDDETTVHNQSQQ